VLSFKVGRAVCKSTAAGKLAEQFASTSISWATSVVDSKVVDVHDKPEAPNF